MISQFNAVFVINEGIDILVLSSFLAVYQSMYIASPKETNLLKKKCSTNFVEHESVVEKW